MIEFEDFKTKGELVSRLIADQDVPCQTAAEAEKYIREHLPKESYFQKSIMDEIRRLIPSAFVWKAVAGPYGRAGIPDVCAVIHGRYYGFEVKRPFVGVLSWIQKRTIRQIQAAGGRAYVVSWPREAAEALKDEIGVEGINGR